VNLISELRSVTCHMISHSATCHPTQVNAPHLKSRHAGQYSIYLSWRDGRLSLPWCWLYTEMVYLSTDSHPHISTSYNLITTDCKSNSRPLDPKSNVLTITLTSHLLAKLLAQFCYFCYTSTSPTVLHYKHSSQLPLPQR